MKMLLAPETGSIAQKDMALKDIVQMRNVQMTGSQRAQNPKQLPT